MDRASKLHLLCPICALACYVECTAPIRRTEQLSVCFEYGMAGKALYKRCLASWLCERICQAYRWAGSDPPSVVSTRSVVVSMALFSGLCVEDICTAVPTMSVYTVLPLGYVRLQARSVQMSFETETETLCLGALCVTTWMTWSIRSTGYRLCVDTCGWGVMTVTTKLK